MKKILSILSMALIVGTSLFAGGAAETEKTPITIWAWDPNFNISIMKDAAEIYQQSHPDVEFNIVEMAKADVEQKLHTNLAARTTDGLPDIVLIEDYNGLKYLNSYPGQFADLTDEINQNDFLKSKVDVAKVGNKYYSMPFDSGVAGFFYRTDMLAQAGYTAEDLTNITWDEFCDIAKDYKEKTGNYFFANSRADGGLLRIMLQSDGSWYFDEDGNPYITDNDSLAKAMEIYKRFISEDLAFPTNGWTEWVGAINDEKVPTITSGVWIIGSIKAATEQSGLWAVAPCPRLSENGTNASNLGGSSWYVLENGKNKEEAIDFLNAIYGADTDFYQNILVKNGAMGSYIPAFGGANYSKADEFFGGQKVYDILSQYAEDIPAVNIGEYTYEADAAVMGNMEAFYDGQSIEATLEAIEAQLANDIL
ncbi:MAG: ABC transporter substrate-binding protein [Sphaerochaetaceae bacterium]|nr:ABC transporter substrate-binding protein [Sphaerochaetaceae bacterium]